MSAAVVGWLAAWLAAGPSGQAATPPSPEALAQRGITFYVPFENSAQPHHAHGERRFYIKYDVAFCEGKIGRGLKVTGRRWGGTYLAYGLLGNLYGEQGTIAFWFKPGWRAGDPNIYTRSGGGGPPVCGIEAEEVRGFLNIWFRGMRCVWQLRQRGRLPWSAQSQFVYQEPIRSWKAHQWHHMATTWHRDRGMRMYCDGKLVHHTWGKKDGAFEPYTPRALAVGAQSPFRGSYYWPHPPGLVFDELVLMNRPAGGVEVRALMEGRYLDLERRGPEPLGLRTYAERRRHWGLLPDEHRPTIEAAGPTAWVRWQALEVSGYDVDYKHRQHTADGDLDSSMLLQESGLGFARQVRLVLPREQTANYLQVWGAPAADSEVRLPSHTVKLSPTRKDADVVRTGFPATSFGKVLPVWFGRASNLREVTAFHVSTGSEPPPVSGERVRLGRARSAGLQKAIRPLVLRYLNPDDLQILAAGAAPTDQAQTITCSARQILTLTTQPMSRDSGLAGVRVDLAAKGLEPKQVFRVRLVHPEDFRRVYFDADIQLDDRPAQIRRLVFDTFGPGLFYAQRRPVVVQMASTGTWTVDAGHSSMTLVPTTVRAVARAYANRELYALNDEFTGRQSKSRYQLRGETAKTNLLRKWFERILHVDPRHPVAWNLYRWCGFANYPKPDFKAMYWRPDSRGAPEWAWVVREGIRQAARQALWWIEHRQDPETGYIMGDGNQFNDVTKLWRLYHFLPLLTDDQKILDALDRYLACHLKHGHYKDGYCSYLTDALHSAEEASLITGANAFLHDYRPMDVQRLRDTAKHLKFWLGVNPAGHMHFKSNYFTATKMKTEGVFGWEISYCTRATPPAGYLVLATGDADTRRLLLAWGDAWVAAAKRSCPGKPEGVLPSAVQWSTGALRWDGYGHMRANVPQHLLWCYHQTGDPKYLAPIEAAIQPLNRYLDSGEPRPGVPPVVVRRNYGRILLQWRLLTGKSTHDAFLDKLCGTILHRLDWQGAWRLYWPDWEIPACLDWILHKNKSRLVTALKFLTLNADRAFDANTHMDPDTDRLRGCGADLLVVAMLGGPVLTGDASMPYPLCAAVRWYRTGYDFAALVLENTPHRVKLLAYNFAPRTRQVAFKALRLEPGTYRMTTGADRNGDDRSDSVTETRRVTILPGRHRRKIMLDVPSRRVTVVAVAKQ